MGNVSLVLGALCLFFGLFILTYTVNQRASPHKNPYSGPQIVKCHVCGFYGIAPHECKSDCPKGYGLSAFIDKDDVAHLLCSPVGGK